MVRALGPSRENGLESRRAESGRIVLVEVAYWIVEDVGLEHRNGRSAYAIEERCVYHAPPVIVGLDVVGPQRLALRLLQPERAGEMHPARRTTVRHRKSGTFAEDAYALVLVSRLEAVRHTVVSRDKVDAPLAEIDNRFVAGLEHLVLLVDGWEELPHHAPRRYYRLNLLRLAGEPLVGDAQRDGRLGDDSLPVTLHFV